MANEERTILLVSDDDELCAAARRKLKVRTGRLRVAAVNTIEAARSIVVEAAPAVILLEEAVVQPGPEGLLGRAPRLDAVVSSLAIHAPVVVIGPSDRQAEMAALVTAGAADYVARDADCLAVAVRLVEKRLRQARVVTDGAARFARAEREERSGARNEHFGEMLRHELNNPLTGILGNAELLLAEVRRKSDGCMPNGGQQRLETIAALAVRLRETVRRLSKQSEALRAPGQRPEQEERLKNLTAEPPRRGDKKKANSGNHHGFRTS
jgi:signal transduction histidine kinase